MNWQHWWHDRTLDPVVCSRLGPQSNSDTMFNVSNGESPSNRHLLKESKVFARSLNLRRLSTLRQSGSRGVYAKRLRTKP